MKFREEHEQHYQSPGIEYSASDYHHTRRRPVKLLSSRQRLAHSRTHSRRSQFSIVSNDNRPREGSYGPSQTARSVESYDAFRPSLNQLPSTQAEYANITVLRDNPLPAVPSLQPNGSLRHPAVTRLSGAPRSSGLNSAGSSPRASIAPLQGRSGLSGYASRSTITSNGQRATPQVASRSSNSGKRQVTFHHRRKSSNSNPSAAAANSGRDGAKSRFGHRAGDSNDRSASPITRIPDSPGSPDSQVNPLPRSRKGGPTQARVPLEPGKSRAQSKLFKDEVRKVSTELGRYCEEVFNRDSVISNGRTSTTETSPVEHDTPETSASTRAYTPALANDGEVVDSSFRRVARRKVQEPAVEQRPTPKSAAAEHDSYTEAQLRETRDRLLQRSAQGGAGASQAYLDDVIAHLEKLMQPSTVGHGRGGEDGRRTASIGGRGRSPMDHPAGFLPVISEENRAVEGEEDRVSRLGHRAVSAPVSPRAPGQPVEPADGPSAVGPPPASTIRVVLPSMLPPMQPVAPLNVRKRSEQSTNVGCDGLPTPSTPLQRQQRRNASASRPDDGAGWTLWPQDGPLPTRQPPQQKVAAEPTHEAEVSQGQEKTRKRWFRRNLGSGSKGAAATATTTAAVADQRRTSEQDKSKVDDEDTRISFENFLMSGGLMPMTMTKTAKNTKNTVVDHGKEQTGKEEVGDGDGEVHKRRGFLKMFGKRVDAKTTMMHHDLQLILGGMCDFPRFFLSVQTS